MVFTNIGNGVGEAQNKLLQKYLMFLDKDVKPFNGRKDNSSQNCVKNNTHKECFQVHAL